MENGFLASTTCFWHLLPLRSGKIPIASGPANSLQCLSEN